MAHGIIQERGRRLTPEEMIERLSRLHEITRLSLGRPDRRHRRRCPPARRTASASAAWSGPTAWRATRPSDPTSTSRSTAGCAQPTPTCSTTSCRTSSPSAPRSSTRASPTSCPSTAIYTASMLLSRCSPTPAGSPRWNVDVRSEADVVIVVRMDPTNEQPSDYYLLPRMGIDLASLRLWQHNGARIDTYRFDTLSFFTEHGDPAADWRRGVSNGAGHRHPDDSDRANRAREPTRARPREVQADRGQHRQPGAQEADHRHAAPQQERHPTVRPRLRPGAPRSVPGPRPDARSRRWWSRPARRAHADEPRGEPRTARAQHPGAHDRHLRTEGPRLLARRHRQEDRPHGHLREGHPPTPGQRRRAAASRCRVRADPPLHRRDHR